MTATRMCAAALVRRGWAGVIVIALLVGVGGGAVLAAAAGARRTGTAATRLYRRGKVADLELDQSGDSLVSGPPQLAAIRRIPQVSYATTAEFFGAGVVDGDRPPQQLNVFVAANTDGTWIYKFDRIGMLPSFRGRLPAPNRDDEVVATTAEARDLHVGIGSTLRVAVAKFARDPSAPPSYSKPITLHVVGIATTPVGLLHGGETSETFLFGSPAFGRRFADRSVGGSLYVLLRHPGDLLAFERQIPRALPALTFSIQSASQELSAFSRVASPYTNALWIFALVAGIAALLILAQTLVRVVRTDAGKGAGLDALGATSVQRAAVAASRAALAVVAGTVIAVIVAIAASPLFPLGLVHRVEPHPGVRADFFVLAAGAFAIVFALGVVVAATGWSAARRPLRLRAATTERTSKAASALARANAPVTIVQGTRLAFRRGGRTGGTTIATSIFGIVAALAAMSAALVFGANLHGLTTPRRYGQTWSAEISSNNPQPLSPADVERTLGPSVATGLTFGTFGDLTLDHQQVASYGLQPQRGHVVPLAVRGHIAQADDEIAIGARTLRQLHRSVGDTVTARGSTGRQLRLRIVGQTLLPALNPNEPVLGADDGAQLTRATLVALDPDLKQTDFVLLELAPAATMQQLRKHFDARDFTVSGASPPTYIASYGNVQSTPLILAGLLILLGIGVLSHLLITSLRANRRELAILKTLGCRGRQLSLMVTWQAVLLVSIALTVGLTIGVVVGRAAWTRFATGLGLAPSVDIPVGQVAAVVTIALVVAALLAAIPARAATRVQPARVLHAE